MLRIGIEANSYFKDTAGTGTYVRNIVANLQEEIEQSHGAEIFLFTSAKKKRIILGDSKNIFIILLNWIRTIFWVQISLPILLKKDKINILFCPGYLCPIFSPCPVIFTIHDATFVRYPETVQIFFLIYLKLTIPIIKRLATVILTVSNFSKEEISRLLKISPKKIKAVYNGCNRGIFRVINDIDKINWIKIKYNILPKFILNVGTIEPRKNLIRLISAFNILKKEKLIEHKLVLCGPKGWCYDEVLQKVKDLNLLQEVVFIGYVSEKELPLFYNAADIFVYPSIYEGFGLPVVEAMACACPVVTSNISSLPEITGNAALLVNPFSVEEIARGMYEVLSNDNLRLELKQKGLNRAEMFLWRKAAKETLGVFKEVYMKTKMKGEA